MHRNFILNTPAKNQASAIVLIYFIILLTPLLSFTQARNYSLLYSDNIKGGTTIFGNTLLQIINMDTVNTNMMNDNSANGNSIYGNDNANMQYVDIDGSTDSGSETFNSSSSDLILPSGNNTIKLARLYWGGRVRNADFDLTLDSNQTIKIRKDTSGAYSTFTAQGIDKILIVSGYSQYQAYTDITDFVKQYGAGTYEVGNAPLSVGAIDNGGNNGGWSIVVVYENDSLSYNSIRIYDGFEQVYNNGNPLTTTVTLSGLNVPSGILGAGDAKMGVLAWEGDANITGDFLEINSNLFSNATNQPDNVWNGTITNNGVNVTTKNPNYTNQMGVDIDQFDVGTGYDILPNASSVSLEFGTTGDKYYPGLFTFCIKMKDPTLSIVNNVGDANNDQLGEANEILTYTLTGKNSGAGNANSTIITDTLPPTVSYVPNSLNIISACGTNPGFQTDAPGDDLGEYITTGTVNSIKFRIGNGSSPINGGSLAPGDTYEVQFKVTVNDPGPGKQVPSIMNIARISAVSDAGEAFTNDATSIINPDSGPLPVTLISFTAVTLPNKKVKLNWSTSMEINCKDFEIERSIDGNVFNDVAEVAGNGTTYLLHSYSAEDDISSVTNSTIYYRIRQMDLDGNVNYSNILPVKIDYSNSQITISPNPFNDYLNINLDWNNYEIMVAKLLNVQGKTVFVKNIQMKEGRNVISVPALSNLPAGIYFLEFISDSQMESKKIIKQ